jgi:predicted Zn-dependent peptidase
MKFTRPAAHILTALVLCLLPALANAYLDLAAARVQKLDNGLTVIVLEEHSFPVVSVQMLYKSGARDESTGATGLAHFLEHMAFRQSTNFPDTELVSSIYAVGGEWHGYTWLDQTTYFETTPVANLELLLRIEADRMSRLKIPAADVDSERGAVLTEMHSYENDPTAVLHDNVMYVSFLAHAYRNNTIGWESDIANISHAQLVEFYKQHYRPGNAVLAVVGDVSTNDVMQLVTKYFAGLKGSAPPTEPHTVEPEQNGERRIRLEGPVDKKYFKIVYRAPSVVKSDYAAFLVTQELLAAGSGVSFLQNDWGTPARPGSALAGISDDLTTWFPPSAQDYVFGIAGTLSARGDEKALENGIETAIRNLGMQFNERNDENVARLDIARERVLRELTFDVQTTEDAAHQLAFFAGLDALDVLTGLPQALQQVSTQDIQRIVERWLGSEKRTVGWYVPGEKKVIASVPAAPEEPEESGETVPAEISEPNEEAKPVSERTVSVASLQHLSNGTPVIVQPSTLSATAMLKVIVPAAEFSLPAGVSQGEPALGLYSLDFDILPDELDQAISRARELVDSATPVEVPASVATAGPAALLQGSFNDLLGFHYTPAAPVAPVLLVVTGDIDPAGVLAGLESAFGSLPAGKWVAPPARGEIPPVDIEKYTSFPVAQEQLGYLVGVPGPRAQTALAWQMALYILSHGYEGRLGKEAISRRGLIYYIDSAYNTDGNNDWITLSIGVDPDKLPAMKKLLREELDWLVTELPSAEEVEEARAHLLGRFASAAQSNRELAETLSNQWILYGDLPDYERLERQLKNVSSQQIIELLPAFTEGSIVSIRNPRSGSDEATAR